MSERRFTYNGFGRVTSATDPLSRLTVYAYDDAGNLTGLNHFPSPDSPATSRLTYTYDALDRVLTEGDGAATKVSYVYDNYGGLGPPDPGSPVGRLTAVFDLSGSTFFTYDSRGNIRQKFVTLAGLNGLCLGNWGPPICGSFEYDFSYDDQNRLLTITFPAFPTLNSARPVQTFTYSKDGVLTDIAQDGTAYAHHSNFNALKQVGAQWLFKVCLFEPNNCTVANETTYAYQADHLVQNLRTTKAGIGRVGTGTRSDLIIQDDTYSYDLVGNLISISDNRPTSAKTYTYMDGNRTVSVNTDHSATSAYDALDRLTAWVPSGSPNIGTYAYDTLGNLTGDGGDAVAYTSCGSVGAPGHCITRFAGSDSFENATLEHFAVVPLGHGTLVPVSGETVWSAEHDSEGKRTTLFVGANGGIYTYAYDYKQRLNQVTHDGHAAATESYQYNYAGERTHKIFSQGGGSTTTWFIGPDFEVQQSSSDPAGTYSTTRYIGDVAVITAGNPITGQASAPTVAANAGKAMTGDLDRGNAQGTYLRIEDRQGSTAIMTQSGGPAITGGVSGAELSRYTYDPWGQRLQAASPSDTVHHETGFDTTPVQYTGQRYEDYSGLMFYGARYYDPTTRRFLVADDPGGGSNTAQALNRYAYVYNNPLRYVDPTGHQADDEIPTISFSMQIDSEPVGDDSSDEFGIGQLRCGVCNDPSFDVVFSSNGPLETRTSDVAASLAPDDPFLGEEMENGMPVQVPGEAFNQETRYRFGLSEGAKAGLQTAADVFNPPEFIDRRFFSGWPVTQLALAALLHFAPVDPVPAESIGAFSTPSTFTVWRGLEMRGWRWATPVM